LLSPTLHNSSPKVRIGQATVGQGKIGKIGKQVPLSPRKYQPMQRREKDRKKGTGQEELSKKKGKDLGKEQGKQVRTLHTRGELGVIF
jgi:hypothetical protein